MIQGARRRISLDAVRAFYMSSLYPVIVSTLVAVGSILGIELYLGIIHTALIFGAFTLSKSIKPIIISLLTYVMQLSVGHAPFYPTYSDYYYTGWRLSLFIVFVAVTALGAVIFVIRNKIYKRVSFKGTPILTPAIILAVAFMLNGLFSGKWVIGDLLFGFSNAVVYLVLFVLIYHGFSDGERASDIAKYLSFISVLISLVISAELIAHLISADNAFIDGSINKTAMALGWGIWNLVGVSLSVLIPVIFYGMHVNKYPWLYFASATLTYAMAVLTMSRNALLFSTLAYAASVIISCFVGKSKRVFRIISISAVAAAVIMAIIFWDKIYALLGDYFSRGLSDNGRFALWRSAFDNFLKSPVFGGGFNGFNVETDVFGPLVKQAHNTVLQFLSATGSVGLICYGYYRYKSIKPLFHRPSLMKTMMALSIAVLLFGSLLDNFIFNIYPMFYYTVALEIIHKADREADGEI